MSESRRDLALLDTLMIALDPPDVDPSAESLFRLRVAVAEHHGLVDARRPAAAPARVPWWRRPWAVASMATGMALAGTGTAMATGAAPMPRPVRVVAHAVGLPVDSPDVADVRHANEVLKKDLSTPGAPPASSTAHDAETLQRRLAQLSSSERARVGADPHRTLDRARPRPEGPSQPSQPYQPPRSDSNQLHRSPSSGERSRTSTPPTTSAPSHSSTPTSQPSYGGDRHGDSGSGGSEPSRDGSSTSGSPGPRP